jgi:hypothetical protein
MTVGSAAVLIIIKQFLLNLSEQIAGEHFEISLVTSLKFIPTSHNQPGISAKKLN